MNPPRFCPAPHDQNNAGTLRRRDWLAGAGAALSGLAPSGLTWAAPPALGDLITWPEVELLDGGRFGPSQARGKHVLVVFWSTTCPFCLRHNAHIEKLRKATAGRQLALLTVARDKDPAQVRKYLSKHGYELPVTLNQTAMTSALSGQRVIPLSVLVDPQGRLKSVIPGEMFEEDVMEWEKLA